jgi:hypothetical protein
MGLLLNPAGLFDELFDAVGDHLGPRPPPLVSETVEPFGQVTGDLAVDGDQFLTGVGAGQLAHGESCYRLPPRRNPDKARTCRRGRTLWDGGADVPCGGQPLVKWITGGRVRAR